MTGKNILICFLVFGVVVGFLSSPCGAQQEEDYFWIAKPRPGAEGVQKLKVEEETAYLLGPEDVLEVSVWKDPELTKEVTIQPDGYFSYPLLGQILAKGRTVVQVQAELSEKLGAFVSEPVVTVLLKKVLSYKIFVIGKVTRPGPFSLGEKVNVMQALTVAGGVTPFASPGKILILRQKGDTQQKIPFDYDDVSEGKHMEQNILLKSGDVVVVP